MENEICKIRDWKEGEFEEWKKKMENKTNKLGEDDESLSDKKKWRELKNKIFDCGYDFAMSETEKKVKKLKDKICNASDLPVTTRLQVQAFDWVLKKIDEIVGKDLING